MQHYGWSTGPTVIQIHGMGPFAINYVNPADDPRNNTKTFEKSRRAGHTTTVMPGLVPGTHILKQEGHGWPGQARP
jgi:hypothetical protein